MGSSFFCPPTVLLPRPLSSTSQPLPASARVLVRPSADSPPAIIPLYSLRPSFAPFRSVL